MSTVIGVAALGSLVLGVQPAEGARTLPREGDVRFKVTCNYDHTAPDDPIVAPNQAGASHMHQFFGRENVTAATTNVTALTAAPATTNCNDAGDLASYWTPAVYDAGGNELIPSRMTGYYRRNEKGGTILPYPEGLKIIAGWQNGAAQPPPDIAGWECVQGNFVSSPPRDCRNGISMVVRFPDCWDGVNLDSADHRSHMAYAIDGAGRNDPSVCPASHPVQLPQLTFYVSFDYITNGTQIASLASGATTTVHGDFFNGWDPARLQERVDTCLNGFQRCDSGDGSDPRLGSSVSDLSATASLEPVAVTEGELAAAPLPSEGHVVGCMLDPAQAGTAAPVVA